MTLVVVAEVVPVLLGVVLSTVVVGVVVGATVVVGVVDRGACVVVGVVVASTVVAVVVWVDVSNPTNYFRINKVLNRISCNIPHSSGRR